MCIDPDILSLADDLEPEVLAVVRHGDLFDGAQSRYWTRYVF